MKTASALLALLAATAINAAESDIAAPHAGHPTNYVMKLEQLQHLDAAAGLTAVFPSSHYTLSFLKESPLCQVEHK